jgi:hypothetical protein
MRPVLLQLIFIREMTQNNILICIVPDLTVKTPCISQQDAKNISIAHTYFFAYLYKERSNQNILY